jgi:DNA-binding NarL/FixJ family response regulator
MDLVAEASNGHEAVQQFRAHFPDVTLMDLQMPGMNGLDAIIAIRGEFPEARIIIMTTFANDVEIQRTLEAGARAYILKSLPPSRIMDVIRRVRAGETRIHSEIAAYCGLNITMTKHHQGAALRLSPPFCGKPKCADGNFP